MTAIGRTLLAALWSGLFLACGGVRAEEASPEFVSVDEGAGAGIVRGATASTKFFAPIDILVRGGRPANLKQWPASFHSRYGTVCGGTLVGARVLLTAAHCVEFQRQVSVRRGSTTSPAECDVADGRLDQALCLLERPISGPAFERINVDPGVFLTLRQLTFVGAGCTTDDGTGSDGIFREGVAEIDRLPSGTGTEIFSEHGAYLCPGDSGGGAFVRHERGRLLVAVNSATKSEFGGDLLVKESYFSSTSVDAAVKFMRKWASTHGVDICGVTANAKNCQSPL